ncbi:MAG: type II secretion system protein [bacterium]|nr:type II secretion system protein [bacterium]
MKKGYLKGFSLVELLVAMGLFSLLFGFIWVNLLGSRGRASQSSSIDVFVADLRSTQLKAMQGDSEGRVDPEIYGVYVGANSYTLFHGSTYNPTDPSNHTVSLGDGETFVSVAFPNNSVIFDKGSGELIDFDPALTTLTLSNSISKTQKTIQMNKYGVITAIN